ncbi:MAG: diguanylate cyclase [Pseudomonadota bacterium]
MSSNGDGQGARPTVAVRTLPATLLYSSERTRIYRMTGADGGSIICKEPLGPDAYERLRHEQDILARLEGVAGVPHLAQANHPPNVIALREYGGVPLAQVLQHERLAVPAILKLALSLCRIVAAVHARGVVHRDINPGNILLAGPERVPVLIDFHLASALAELPGAMHQHEIAGTLAYLSPEQAGRTGRTVDHRADLYAFGATLYELAVGHPPFQQKDVLQLVHDQLTRTPPAPATLAPGLPALLSELIMRLLEKEPDQRYQSAEGLAHDLARMAAQLDAGERPDFPLARRDFTMRLAAPERLIGRDSERAALLAAFERAMTESGRGVLLCGAAGVGKSKLVAQLRPLVAARGGYFVAGKFDQLRQDRQSDGVHMAFQALGCLLLAEPEAALLRLRADLLDALGANARLMTASSPEFAILLGIAPEVLPDATPELPARIFTAVTSLLRAVVSPRRPLVMAIDDVQWASPLALNILNSIMLDPDLRGLLLVSAWRTDQLPAGHPVASLLAQWERHGAARIELGNLPLHDVGVLLEDMLRLPAAPATALAAALAGHTGGNPYDTVELVNALRHNGVLRADEDGWNWDPAALRRHVGLSSVTDLLRARIERLPADTRALVEVMACMGGEVRAGVLAAAGLTPRPPDTQPDTRLDTLLAPALEDGLLTMDTDAGGALAVRFRHDRVQQTVYDAMDQARRNALHLTIARRLDAVPDSVAMTAAQYLPVAASLVSEERDRAIALFRQAAHLVRLSNYAACEHLLGAALDLLGEPGDEAGRGLAHELRAERHAALIRLGRPDDADALYAVIDASGVAPPVLAGTACLQITSLLLRRRPQQALALSMLMLERLGLPLERLQGAAAILEQLAAFETWLERETGNDPLLFPEVQDQRIRAIAMVLERGSQVAFFIDDNLLASVALAAWQLWREHGACAPMIAPLSAIGMVAIRQRKQYRLGYAVSRFLLDLTEARAYVLEGARVHSMFAVNYAHWFDPIEDSVAHARQAHEVLMQAGDVTTACLPLIALVCGTLESAPSLSAVVAEASTALGVAARATNEVVAPYFRQVLALAHTLHSEAPSPAQEDLATFTPVTRCSWHLLLAMRSALMDELDLLVQHGEAACAARDNLHGGYGGAIATLLWAVALARQAQACTPDQRPALLAAMTPWRGELAQWAADAPANFRHLLAWLDAERAWAEADYRQASQSFDDALSGLEGRQRPWHLALITERAGLFYLAHGMRRAGRGLLADARRHYHAWGAAAKVLQLERNHPFLQGGYSHHPAESERRGSVSTDSLHMLALLRASQALSSETSLARLQTRVAEQLGAMTGATEVRMMLPGDGGGWTLAGADGTATADPAPLAVEQAAAAGLLPLSAFRYVERTRAALVVEDATRDDRFAHDSYFAGMAQCSLLLLPILNQGALRAMLMLENRQRRGAFAADRLEAVQLIAGQLAVSLDNAMLYASLERKVAERTQALELANRELAALSVTDALTGLANRRHFNQALEAEWLRSLRPRTPLGAAMIDVDQFKLYNDHYGHQQGDACLKMVADALAKSVRHGVDLVARYGGEEFAIILPGADLTETRIVAERARAAVAALRAPHLTSMHGVVTVSIGIASLVPAPDLAPAGLFGTADAALYQAKQQGRNRVTGGAR